MLHTIYNFIDFEDGLIYEPLVQMACEEHLYVLNQ